MKERRKYPRFNLSHPVVYDVSDRESGVLCEGTTRTEDVSRGGLRIKFPRLVETGSVMNMRIGNSAYDEPVDVDAEVVWGVGGVDDSAILGLAFTRIGWIESDKLLTPDAGEVE